jgi:hypothetical protein
MQAFSRKVDAVRALYPSEPMYTLWDYKRNRWERDGGLRLDHIFLSPLLTGRLDAAGVDRAVRGSKEASDHAPVWIKLSEAAKSRTISIPRKRPTRPKATTRRKAARDPANSIAGGRPLLVIHGGSFAHRA